LIKTLSKAQKMEREKFRIPRSVQDAIPIRRIFADGIFQVGNRYSKTWSFTDINYAIASKEDKTSMFLDYSELLNALDSGASAKITIYNRRINKAAFERSVLLPDKDDGLDEYRHEFNQMLTAQVTGTSNSIVRERYLTVSVVKRKYQPTGGYNTYSVQRQGDGSYAVINSAAYATTDSMRHTLYYTQRNAGKFIIVETKAPTGYFGDWTDINHPGMANTPLGKRGYYIEITEDSDNSVIWLDNADYNADIATTDKGGTKLVTSTGVETTVTIYDTAKDPSRTYNTDNSGKAANEDSYTVTPTDGIMKNDRTLGEISISKVDLDAVRYVGGSTAHGTALASGQAHGDAVLDGAVYDLYAAEDITHPDGVTGVVDYSKIVDADGNPIWHTTIRDNSGQWVSDFLPALKKDHLVASAKIENGWLCFSNLYLGKYYVVERSTGVVIPLRDGALAVSGTYPTVDSRTKAATGQTAALAKNGSGQYTDWVYKNQFSTVSKAHRSGTRPAKHHAPE